MECLHSSQTLINIMFQSNLSTSIRLSLGAKSNHVGFSLLNVIVLAGGCRQASNGHRVAFHHHTQRALHIALYSRACVLRVCERSPFLIEAVIYREKNSMNLLNDSNYS